MAVGDGDAPARALGRQALERDHVAIVAMGAAGDLEIEFGKQQRFVMRHAENVEIGGAGQARGDDRPRPSTIGS